MGQPVGCLMQESLEDLLRSPGKALAGDHHLRCLGVIHCPLRVGVMTQDRSPADPARRLDDQEHIGNVRVVGLDGPPGVIQHLGGDIRDLDVGVFVVHGSSSLVDTGVSIVPALVVIQGARLAGSGVWMWGSGSNQPKHR